MTIRRQGYNEDYQNPRGLPFAQGNTAPGVTYFAGIEIGGRRCPRCDVYIAVTSPVRRLSRPDNGCWWVHERCDDARPDPEVIHVTALEEPVAMAEAVEYLDSLVIGEHSVEYNRYELLVLIRGGVTLEDLQWAVDSWNRSTAKWGTLWKYMRATALYRRGSVLEMLDREGRL